MTSLPSLKSPQFVTFPVLSHDPNFGSLQQLEGDVEENASLWKLAAENVVNDPEETRSTRLTALKEELKCRQIQLYPGDDNQLLSFLRAGQGHVSRAMHVVDVFLQYQRYEKKGKQMVVDRFLLTPIDISF